MLLTLRERLLLLTVLPAENDLLSMRIVRDLKAVLGPTEEEFKTYKIVQLEGGQIQWDTTNDKGVEIAIGDKAKEIIQNSLRELDKQKKVTEAFLDMYEKFDVQDVTPKK